MVPGLILAFALGLVPLFVARGLWKGRRWAWYGAVAVGTALSVWIAVETMIMGLQLDPPLQLIFGGLGLAIAGVTLSRPLTDWADTEAGTARAAPRA